MRVHLRPTNKEEPTVFEPVDSWPQAFYNCFVIGSALATLLYLDVRRRRR